MRRVAPALALLLLLPASVRAVTVDEIVSMARSGVSEQVLLAVIERDKTIFALDGDQIVALQRQGVSEPVVIAMLRSGRQPAPAEPPAAAVPPAPDLVIVGHAPDRPNTDEPVFLVPGPLYVPLPFAGYGSRTRHGRAAVYDGSFAGRRFAADPMQRFMNSTFVPFEVPDSHSAERDEGARGDAARDLSTPAPKTSRRR